MSALQLWMLAGVLTMGGVAALVWWLSPAEPDLVDVLGRLAPGGSSSRRAVEAGVAGVETSDRLGLWAMKHLPSDWLKTPVKDLALLGKPVYAFYGEKLLLVAITVVAAPVLSAFFVIAFHLPLVVPLGLTIAAAVLVWFLPGQEVKSSAKAARIEFSRAMGSYVDLVALDRRAGGSGTRQAMENAAAIGSSWPFRRVSDALARSRFSGVPPWDALHDLAEELDLPDLDDLADIMRLSGEEGAQVYESLRARSTAMRHSMLSAEQTRANELGERMVFPTTMMGAVFGAIVIAPGIMRLFTG